VAAISVVVMAMAVAGVMRSKINANESCAKETLKTIAAAAEQYARENKGLYPANISNLTASNPPFLTSDNAQILNDHGYALNCPLSTNGGLNYSCSARPISIGSSGTKQYTITQGMVLAESMARSNLISFAIADGEQIIVACTKDCDTSPTGETSDVPPVNGTDLVK
jgi:type II secretory pathway pseudopilin PulG